MFETDNAINMFATHEALNHDDEYVDIKDDEFSRIEQDEDQLIIETKDDKFEIEQSCTESQDSLIIADQIPAKAPGFLETVNKAIANIGGVSASGENSASFAASEIMSQSTSNWGK